MTTITIDRSLPEQAAYLLDPARPAGHTLLARRELAIAIRAALAVQPSVPAWHDAPTVPGLWLCDEGDENPYRFTCHNVSMPLNPHLVGEGERWYGPIPENTP